MAAAPPPDDRTIARAIRKSRLMDAALKKHWLAVLPHLAAEDRVRLWAILVEANGQIQRGKAER
ncbi:MAG: hypothetical protein HY331_02805 [Chloroflexi bacterium]|nr:hypothetical protein [Chloroflexota bacterium]